jgi:hypothetical protein
LSFSHIETFACTTSKGDAEKIDCGVAATVTIRTPEVQNQNLVVVGLHVVLASEAVVYEGFWQQRWGVDQICKEGRLVSRTSGRFCLGLAVIFAVRVKEFPQFSRITFVYYDEHSCVSRTSCIANCNARVFQNTYLANANSTKTQGLREEASIIQIPAFNFRLLAMSQRWFGREASKEDVMSRTPSID